MKANVLFFDRKPARETPWTQDAVGLRPADEHALHAEDEPAAHERTSTSSSSCYQPERPPRAESRRTAFRRFTYDELVARDKASLDIFWLRDESLEDADDLPPPDVIAAEIVEDLEAALAEFTAIAASLAAEDGEA